VQDSSSSVYALSAEDGALRWKHTFSAPNDGPNGLTIVDGRIYTATDTTALALDAATGKLLWQRRLANRLEQFVAIAPVVDRGRVYYSAQGFPRGGRGALYALSLRTGKLVWRSLPLSGQLSRRMQRPLAFDTPPTDLEQRGLNSKCFVFRS
jgi:outer membrane protein assembly factor BamB